MIESILSFILKYKYILLFYLVIIIFLVIRRKGIDVQAKIILLYRMKFGLAFIEKFAQKYRQSVILLGYIGVGAGYVGLGVISVVLVKNLYDLVVKPSATSGVSLVLPGINVPGMGVLPFWYWILAIFVIASIHEFAHGIVARAHKIPVKNTGLVFLGPIIGAFVEPEEKNLRRQSDIKQYSVLAAGSFSNILLAIVALLLLNFAFVPLQQTMVEPTGFSFAEYHDQTYPAAKAGIPPKTLITGIDGQDTKDFYKFSEKLNCQSPGKEITVSTKDKNYALILTSNPADKTKPYMGIKTIKNEFKVKEKYDQGFWKVIYVLVDWFAGFFRWLFLLSLGIGLFNLLPLPIVDGGRMVQVFLHKSRGRKRGESWYRGISMFFLMVLLLNLFYPMIRGWFGV